jgi:hypothetical protein
MMSTWQELPPGGIAQGFGVACRDPDHSYGKQMLIS